MAQHPIKVWNGTAWEYTGPAVAAPPVKYQATAPTSPATGDVWVESDVDVATFDPAQIVRGGAYTNAAARAAAIPSPVTGMISYIGDSTGGTPTIPQVEAYNGSSWQNLGGLVLLNTTTFSAQTGVAVDNIFTSTYRRYKLIINLSSSATANLALQFRKATVATATGYFTAASGVSVAPAANNLTANNTGYALINFLYNPSSNYFTTTIDLESVQLATPTTGTFNSIGVNSSNVLFGAAGGIAQSNNTDFDGFIISPTSGNITGNIAVYGYRNS